MLELLFGLWSSCLWTFAIKMDSGVSMRVRSAIELQEQLLNVVTDEIETVAEFILSSGFLETSFERRRLAQNILTVLEARPFQVTILPSLCLSIQGDGETFSQFLVSLIFTQRLTRIRIAFVRRLVSIGAVSIDDVLPHLTGLHDHDILLWFARELYSVDQSLFFFSEIGNLGDDNWQMFEVLTNSFYNVGPAAKIIENDDVNSLDSVEMIQSHLFICDELIHKPLTPIEYAAVFDSVKCFDALVSRCDITSLLRSLTEISISYGSKRILQKLVTIPEFSSQFALEVAAARHRNDIFQWIFANSSAILPFDIFCASNNLEILMEHFTELSETPSAIESMMINAVKHDHIEVVELLMQAREGWLAFDETGRNAPMFAIENNDIAILTLFCERAPSEYIIAKDVQGTNLLLFAIQMNHPDIVKYLLSMNIFNVNDRDNHNDVPLLAAIRTGNHEILDALLSHKDIDISVRGLRNTTSLLEAIRANNQSLIAFLFEQGVSLNDSDSTGCTPLLAAIDQNNTELVRVLLEHDCSVIDIPDSQGVTPFMLAVKLQRVEIVALLIEHGINAIEVNAQDRVCFLLMMETLPSSMQ